uniref:Uncharacterized protein n=1 Tax=Populus trichocarpa TaxID=3694 RepID=U5FQT5_POPTR
MLASKEKLLYVVFAAGVQTFFSFLFYWHEIRPALWGILHGASHQVSKCCQLNVGLYNLKYTLSPGSVSGNQEIWHLQSMV